MRYYLIASFLFLTGPLLAEQAQAPRPGLAKTPNYNPKLADSLLPHNKPVYGVGSLNGNGASEEPLKEEDDHHGQVLHNVTKLMENISFIIFGSHDSSSKLSLSSAASPCSHITDLHNKCSSLYHNPTFPPQAPCLCYTTPTHQPPATWAPAFYDGLISSCNTFARQQTVVTAIRQIGNVSGDFNLCSSAGDVMRATLAPTMTGSTTTATAMPPASSLSTQTPFTTSIGAASRNSGVGSLIVGAGFWICKLMI